MINRSAILIAVLSVVIIGCNGYRLPKNVIPTHYDVRIRTKSHTGAEDLQGTVRITVDVVEPTRKIVMHALGISILNVSIFSMVGNNLGSPEVGYDKSHEQLILTWHGELEIGRYLIWIKFETTNSKGWIVRQYEDDGGVQRYFLTTQFEPTYARTAFPCFDEPAMKATFSLEIEHHRSVSVDSNMPIIGRPKRLEWDYVLSSFEKTPKMSTYLLAFTVTEGYRSSGSGNHTTKARGSLLEKTVYPLEVAKEILGVMDQYTGLPYKDYLPKLTHLEVPIPRNWWGAKENWGLIVYCEDRLFHDPMEQHLDQQRLDLLTISHELAHMWFGNLVTPEWWDYVWLKEGFASLYMYYGLHLARPSEHWMEWFNLEVIPKGLKTTWDNDVITRQCENSYDIRDNYRSAIFERAGSVFNMFRQIIGDSTWQLIMRNFLKNHQLQAVVPSDLYVEIEKATNGSKLFPSNITIEQTINSWMTSHGMPMLNVKRNYTDSTITVSQHQTGIGKYKDRIVPYNYAQESTANFDEVGPIQWLVEPSNVIPTKATADEWVLFSKRHLGLYRINYDERNWKLLAQALRSNISCMPRENRAQLLADARHFHEKDQLDKSVLFDLLTFLPNETESLVWYAALPVIDSFKQNLRSVKYQDYFKSFIQHLTKRYYDNIQQSPPTSLYDESVRKSVTFQACQAGNPDCLSSLYKTFQSHVQTNSSDLLPDDAFTVFCFGLQQASDPEFSWVLDQYKEAAGNDRKQGHLMRSLLCSLKIERLRKVIRMIDRKHYNAIAEGLAVDLSAEQFWMLVELLREDRLTRPMSIGVIVQILLTMSSRKQSMEAQNAMVELKERFRGRMRESRIGYWYIDYTSEHEDPSNARNKELEEFVRRNIPYHTNKLSTPAGARARTAKETPPSSSSRQLRNKI